MEDRMTDTTGPEPPQGPQRPNDVLAAQIVSALEAEGLVTEHHKAALLAKLKGRGVTQDDWNLWIDVATAPEADVTEADDD
jgi:hypothetical protein